MLWVLRDVVGMIVKAMVTIMSVGMVNKSVGRLDFCVAYR